jgi:hypothetical protein
MRRISYDEVFVEALSFVSLDILRELYHWDSDPDSGTGGRDVM